MPRAALTGRALPCPAPRRPAAQAVCNYSRQVVALKVYHLNNLCQLNRFQIFREIRLHASFHHPHIIHLFAAFQVGRGACGMAAGGRACRVLRRPRAPGALWQVAPACRAVAPEASLAGSCCRRLLLSFFCRVCGRKNTKRRFFRVACLLKP
jgi:hypothetical protein